VAAVGRKGRVVHIAHSQGALVTSLAAKQLSPLEMNQIEVLAFGGAAALRRTPQTPFLRCINYYAVNDPLLLVVPSAEQALRSGFLVDEFCFLAPRVGDPIADHHLLGPTYAKALSWEGQKFQRQYQLLAYRSLRSFILFFISLLDIIMKAIKTSLRKGLRPLLSAPLSQYIGVHFIQPLLLIGLAVVHYAAKFPREFRDKCTNFVNRER
jgi:hypothetical protein